MDAEQRKKAEQLVDRIIAHTENMRRACGMDPTVLYVSKEIYDQIQNIPDAARTEGKRTQFLGLQLVLREGMADFLAMPYISPPIKDY